MRIYEGGDSEVADVHLVASTQPTVGCPAPFVCFIFNELNPLPCSSCLDKVTKTSSILTLYTIGHCTYTPQAFPPSAIKRGSNQPKVHMGALGFKGMAFCILELTSMQVILQPLPLVLSSGFGDMTWDEKIVGKGSRELRVYYSSARRLMLYRVIQTFRSVGDVHTRTTNAQLWTNSGHSASTSC